MILFKLIKRNILVYVRDRSSVFFSLLSTLIVLALMISFLGNVNVESTLNILEDTSDKAREGAQQLIVLWTIAGILVVNAISITMTMIGFMVKDQEENKMMGFFVAPVKRIFYTLGYIFAANIVAFVMCVITLAFAEIYIVASGGEFITASSLLKLLLVIFVNVFSASATMLLFASCIKSVSAYSGLTTIVGTLVGFLAAIYIPYGSMPIFLQNIIKYVPVYHGASVIREIYTANEVDALFAAVDPMVKKGYNEFMGMNITVFGGEITLLGKCVYLIAVGILFILISAVIMKKKKTSER